MLLTYINNMEEITVLAKKETVTKKDSEYLSFFFKVTQNNIYYIVFIELIHNFDLA